MTALWFVNLFYKGRIIITSDMMPVPYEEASANYVPAAAVIRRMRALFGVIGFKGGVGGMIS